MENNKIAKKIIAAKKYKIDRAPQNVAELFTRKVVKAIKYHNTVSNKIAKQMFSPGFKSWKVLDRRPDPCPDAWYKYQYYKPTDGRSDDLGFVHFESKKALNDYKKAERAFKRGETAPNKTAWFILGMLWAGLIAVLVWTFI